MNHVLPGEEIQRDQHQINWHLKCRVPACYPYKILLTSKLIGTEKAAEIVP